MEEPNKPKKRIWKWLAWGVVGALAAVVIADEARVRWNNHVNEQAWEAEVREQFAKLARMPPIEMDAPAVRAHAIGRVFDARGNGRETTILSTKEIERSATSYREDAKRVFNEHFATAPWRDATFGFSWEARAALVRAKMTDNAGATRNWFIEFKRLGSKVIFLFLDKGASENSITEPTVALLMPTLRSESDDPGGFNHVQCALCGGELEVDEVERFPLMWIVADRTTGRPVPRDTSTKTATSEPVCGKCAATLPPSYVYRMEQ